MRWLFVVIALIAVIAACGAQSPDSGNGQGPCGAGNGQHQKCVGNSPPPTAAPVNGVACAYTPPNTIPFYQALQQIGKTNDGNNTCVPNHQYTEIQIDGKDCTAACTNGSPAPAGFPEPNLGAYRVDAYVDFAEDTLGFGAGTSNQICEQNYPYNVSGNGYPVGFGPPPSGPNGACKPFKYTNPNVEHANEQIAIASGTPIGPNLQACDKPSATIGIYGTPTIATLGNLFNPNPRGELGDKASNPTPGPSNDYDDVEHDNSGNVNVNTRLYFTDTTSCAFKGSNPPPPAPVQNYLAYIGSTHVQHWWAAYDAGCTASVPCDSFPSGLSATPGSTVDFDNYFMYENDQSGANLTDVTACNNSPPCNPAVNASSTQHWANSQAMVNDRITLFQGEQHQHGSNCETVGSCIASGTAFAVQFNGLSNGANNSNSCFGYTASQTGNYGATNALQGNMEQAVLGFGTATHSGSIVEPRSMRAMLNCASDVLANTNGQIKILDHKAVQANYQFYDDDFALRMLMWKDGYIEGRVGLEDATSVPILPVYPRQMLVPDPTSTGSPTMAKFAPPASQHGRDSNGWDGSVKTDNDAGNGCDQWDASSDHGSADLLAATLSHTFGTAGCTGAGFSTYGGVSGCSNLGYAIDWKCNPASVVVREFPKMDYNGYPITDAVNTPIGSAAQYMAVVLNLTALTYTVQCSDLPLEGGANYGHIVTDLPSTPAAGAMDVVDGGSLSIATTFTCGSTTVAPESSLTLVK